jgi:glycerophosphoryl diester phosphodiesterase
VRTLAIAHRGDWREAPENTVAAFAAAVRAGADLVELDVRLTADGAVAVVHDDTLDRVWGVPARVAETPMHELRALGVPDLAEALAAIPVGVMVDYERGDVAEPALAAVVAAGALDRCVFAGGCFDGHRRIRALAPGARIALTWTREGESPFPLLDELGAELFNPNGKLLLRNPSLVERVHAHGTAVSVWTVDDLADMALALDLGVDAVITNRIGELVALLAARETEAAAC